MKLRTLYPNKNPKWAIIILFVIVVILFSLMFFGCATPESLANKALEKDPVKAGKIFRLKFPCIDGVVRQGDSTEYFKFKDSIRQVQEFYDNLLKNIEPEQIITKDLSDSMKVVVLTANLIKCNSRDSLRDKQIKELKAKVIKPVFIHDTIPVKDSFEVKELQTQIIALQADTSALNKQVAKYKGKLHTRNVQALWLLGLVIALLIWAFRKVFVRIFV